MKTLPPKHLVHLLVASTAILILAGCESHGLSVRDQRGQAYPNFVQSLVESPPPQVGANVSSSPGGALIASADAAAATTQPAARLRLPISIAVAQTGEVAPPKSMLDSLR